MKRIFISAVLVGLLVLSGSAALAEEKAKDKNWDFSLAPAELIPGQASRLKTFLTTWSQFLLCILKVYTGATGDFCLM
jgi:hypothetical protein